MKKRSWKVGTKLVVKSVSILSAILIVAFLIIILTNIQTSQKNADNGITSLAESDAAVVKTELEAPLNSARTIAQSMQGYKDIPAGERRSFYDSVMKNVLIDNKSYLGVWACWEPDALDGMDSKNQNTSESDGTGRFIPYWQRSKGEIVLTPLVDYEKEGAGNYYLLAKASGNETILNPYKYEIEGENVLLTSVAIPIKDASGKVIGVTGIDLALSDLQSTVFKDGGYKSVQTYVISNDGTYVINPDVNAIGTSLSDSKQGNTETVLKAISQGKAYLQDGKSDRSGLGVKYVYAPVSIGGTSTPWSVAVEVDNSEVMASTMQMVYMMIIILIALLAIISASVFIIVKFSISKPIKETADFAKKLASGDLDETINIKSNDEIGQLEGILDNEVRKAFKNIAKTQIITEKKNSYQSKHVDKLVVNLERLSSGELYCDMSVDEPDEDTGELHELFGRISDNLHLTVNTLKTYIEEISETLSAMSSGNLSVSLENEYRGEFTALKNSINGIIASFNSTMLEINTAADQVSAGARQVSDGNQAISQGATEQASSIEELTATITQIAQQTKQNAMSANKANELTVSAAGDAAHGNDQMKAMQQAMDEISESSQNIGKIIKVIDDIAFQTNILALNAAVEAARAGVHGKGFAVVAEEVRNLAARSANAAKETTDLIEGSIRKTEAGTRIADETASALSSIVEGVDKAAQLVSEIASASNEQAGAITQVNNGIEQMSQVVQTNSATAEEGAAASEELSSQAEMLKDLVGTFRLKAGADRTQPVRDTKAQDAKEKSKSPVINMSDADFGKY